MRLTEGFERLTGLLEAAVNRSFGHATKRERALTIAVAEIGALIVARGVAKSSRKLSDEILRASRRVLGDVGGER